MENTEKKQRRTHSRTVTRREELVKYINELHTYATPVRIQVIDQLSIIDLLIIAEVDASLSRWMRENDIWNHVWNTKVKPLYQGQFPEPISLGKNQRMNCLAWYFAYFTHKNLPISNGDHVSEFLVQKDTKSHAKVTTVPMYESDQFILCIDNRSILHEMITIYQEKFNITPKDWRVALDFHIPSKDAMFNVARAYYILMELGFYFEINNENRPRYYVRSVIN